MSTRVQVILHEHEREAFRRLARRAGLSLSAWLRLAAQEKAANQAPTRMDTREELLSFFAECDQREAGRGPEPEWETHRKVMEESLRAGLPET